MKAESRRVRASRHINMLERVMHLVRDLPATTLVGRQPTAKVVGEGGHGLLHQGVLHGEWGACIGQRGQAGGAIDFSRVFVLQQGGAARGHSCYHGGGIELEGNQ